VEVNLTDCRFGVIFVVFAIGWRHRNPRKLAAFPLTQHSWHR
jgi:hypothetical protein